MSLHRVVEPLARRARCCTLVTSALAACSASDAEPQERASVDYADVAPILRAHCVKCHRPDGMADFELVTYDDARSWATAIAAATAARAMPPIPAVADGSCRSFRNAAWLDDDELDALARWAEAGAPPSEHVNDVGSLPPDDRLGDDARTVAMPSAYTPAPAPGSVDEYRCFALDPDVEAPVVVTATEFLPGNRELVHHIGVFAVDPTLDLGPFTNGESIAMMEADDPEPGWSCFGGIGAARLRSQISGWGGGSPVVAMPAGSGMTLFPGEILVMQVHYRVHADGENGSDRTALRLQIADDAQRRVTALIQDPLTFSSESGTAGASPPSLPPGLDDARFEWELPASVLWDELEAQEGESVASLDLLGVGPHMHDLGRSLELDVIAPGEAATCGVRVEQWDYAWQGSYFYAEPIRITDPDTRLHVTCHYDTTEQSSPVFAGHDAGREMCALMFYVSPS
jgi:hypothetical protein